METLVLPHMEDVYVRELIRNETPDYGIIRVRFYTIFPDEEGAEKLQEELEEGAEKLQDSGETEADTPAAAD